MRIQPIITEKSMNEAKEGNYSFFVDPALNKLEIKRLIEGLFKVSVVKVRTINKPKSKKRTYTGRYKTILAVKKAIVTLSAKDKIDLFEEKKTKKKAKK
jgi:large subunit ribosomal protein L23